MFRKIMKLKICIEWLSGHQMLLINKVFYLLLWQQWRIKMAGNWDLIQFQKHVRWPPTFFSVIWALNNSLDRQQALKNIILFTKQVFPIFFEFLFVPLSNHQTKIADEIKICKDSGRTSKTLVGSREKIKFTASLLSPSNSRQPSLMRPGYLGKFKMRAQNIILRSAPSELYIYIFIYIYIWNANSQS